MTSTSDRFVDISLRILTLVVGAVLLACIALLLYRWSAPPAAAPAVTLVPVTPKPNVAAKIAAPEPTRAPEVLMAPGKMFQCVVNGRKSFSDRPCPDSTGVTKKQADLPPPR